MSHRPVEMFCPTLHLLNGQELHERERFEGGLTADRDRQAEEAETDIGEEWWREEAVCEA